MADDKDEQAKPSGRPKRTRRDRLINAFTTAPRTSGHPAAGWSPLSTPPPSEPAPARPTDRPRAHPPAGSPVAPSAGPGDSRRGRVQPVADTGGFAEGLADGGVGADWPAGAEPAGGGRGGMRAAVEVGGFAEGHGAGAAGEAEVGGRWSGRRWEVADQSSMGEPTEYVSGDPGPAPPAATPAISASGETYPPVFDPAAVRVAEAGDAEGPAPGKIEALPIDIVGLHGGQWFGRGAEAALWAADVLIGHARQLAVLPSDPPLPGRPVELWGNLDEVLGFAAEQREAGARACVLAAGDPGFFGLARLASARLGDDVIRVHPAPSSVALAFARVGTNWDDALVVSAHGRPLEHAVAAAVDHPKVAVLVSKDQPPQALGRALLDAGCGDRTVTVCSRLGEVDEQVTRTDLAGLAAGRFDPLSVVLVQAPEGARPTDTGMGLRWGRPEADFAHRGGMVTKAEVRAVALGKLGLPPVGTLWDVGAGSGSVAIECARLAPGLRIYAIERRADDIERIRSNAQGSALVVVEGTAPEVLADLPDPDRAFLGGGGLEVLDAVLARLRPGGTVVATYATLSTAAAAAERLGNLVQVQVSRGVPLGPSGQLRLAAENPVFVCWGPA